MGQYYKAVIIEENKTTPKAFFSPWSYDNGAKLMEHSWQKNRFVKVVEAFLKENPQRVVWAGDYAEKEDGGDKNLYDLVRELEEAKGKPILSAKFIFVVNHSKKQFIDKTKGLKDADGWKIHPLPLMTCEGNGQGGGDFYGDSPLVGDWARDLISIEKEVPADFKEVTFDLV